MREADPSSKVYWVDKFITDSLIKLDKQSLQTKDKQVGGERVALSDASAGHHFRERGSIPKNVESRRRNHIHDESNEIKRHLKVFKSFPDKGPLKTIISFFEIQFKSNVSRPTPSRNKSPNNLLDNDNVITRSTARHKPRLTWFDDFFHKGFETKNNDTRK